jgi:hypothetical protein
MSRRITFSPQTIETLSRWYPRDFVERTRFLRGSRIGWLFGRWGQAAVTINRTVHFTPRAPDLESQRGIALLAHELFHVVQQTEMGWWRFFVRYALRWRPIHRKEGWRHPLEAPAYERGREVREALERR